MTNRRGKTGSRDRLFFLAAKITADSDCSHDIRRCLLLGRKAMTKLVVIVHSVMSDSLISHGLQHARLSGPSLSPILQEFAETHVH